MGRKGPTRHLKRHNSPAYWPVDRKTAAWSVRVSTGPHSLNTSIPTKMILRDQLGYAKTAKEAKHVIKQGRMLVDGKPRLDDRFPVGLMDVVSIVDTGENFRVLPDHGGKYKLLPISDDDAKYKLVRITGKATQPRRKTQLNLHDGQNLVVTEEADNYSVNDVLKIKIPEKEIVNHVEFKEMQQSIVTGGRSQGAHGMIIGLGSEPGWKKTCTIRTPEGEDIRTLAHYVFVVGEKEPMITLNAGEE